MNADDTNSAIPPTNTKDHNRSKNGLLRRLLSLMATVSLALSACDKASEVKSASADDDVALQSKHDQFNGDSITASKNFTNQDGVTAQVSLTCTDGSYAPTGLTGMAQIFASVLNRSNLACPDGSQCNAVANIAFFADDNKPASLVATRFSADAEPVQVAYQMKSLPSGKIQQVGTVLKQVGDEFYQNAVVIPIPTRGSTITQMFYRFSMAGRPSPIDVSLNFSGSNLRKFIGICNSHVAEPSPGKPLNVGAEGNVSDFIGGTFQRPHPLSDMKIVREGEHWKISINGTSDSPNMPADCEIDVVGSLVGNKIVAKATDADDPSMAEISILPDGSLNVDSDDVEQCGNGSDLTGKYVKK